MLQREKAIFKTTLVGTLVNILLTGGKFFAGIAGRSSAMIADAVHSLSDLVSDFVVLAFVHAAGKPEDSDHAYGHGKYETMASVIVGLLLGIVGIGLLADGIGKSIGILRGDDVEAPNWWALGAALVSIASKEWLFRYTVKIGRKIDSRALISNAYHHRSDSVTSLATLIGIAGAMLLGPRWRILDPVAAAVVSIYIMIAAWKLVKPAYDELLEKSLDAHLVQEIGNIILSTPGVRAFHRLRTRRTGTRNVISCHIKLDGEMSLSRAHSIASDVERRLREKFGSDTITSIHMEPAKENHDGK